MMKARYLLHILIVGLQIRPFQVNLWIPLTNAYGTNSMFIWNKKNTSKPYEKISKNDFYKVVPSNLKILKDQFLKISYGQILLFNPALHYMEMF